MKTVDAISQPRFVEDPQSPTSEANAHDDSDSADADSPAPWKDRTRQHYLRSRAWVRDNPVAAIGLAVATGFVVGRIFRR